MEDAAVDGGITDTGAISRSAATWPRSSPSETPNSKTWGAMVKNTHRSAAATTIADGEAPQTGARGLPQDVDADAVDIRVAEVAGMETLVTFPRRQAYRTGGKRSSRRPRPTTKTEKDKTQASKARAQGMGTGFKAGTAEMAAETPGVVGSVAAAALPLFVDAARLLWLRRTTLVLETGWSFRLEAADPAFPAAADLTPAPPVNIMGAAAGVMNADVAIGMVVAAVGMAVAAVGIVVVVVEIVVAGTGDVVVVIPSAVAVVDKAEAAGNTTTPMGAGTLSTTREARRLSRRSCLHRATSWRAYSCLRSNS